MGTKLKNARYGKAAKTILFVIMVLSFAGGVHSLAKSQSHGDFIIAFEEHYFTSGQFAWQNIGIVQDLNRLVTIYKSEDHIRESGPVREGINAEVNSLFFEFQCCSDKYDPGLSDEENEAVFLETYGERINQIREQRVKQALQWFHLLLDRLNSLEGHFWYATDGEHEYANSQLTRKEQFQAYRAYMIFDGDQLEAAPQLVERSRWYGHLLSAADGLERGTHKIYLAVDNDYLDRQMEDWTKRKEAIWQHLVWLAAAALAFLLSFAALAAVTGRTSREDRTIRPGALGRWYADVNLAVMVLFSAAVFLGLETANRVLGNREDVFFAVLDGAALLFALVVFPFVLALVRHVKNRTLFRHTLIWTVIRKAANGIGHVYRSGNVAVKTVLLVIGYPLLAVATFFMFPVTLGLAGWFALQKIRAFNAIREGVGRIRAGDIGHQIDVADKGELALLAADINGIAEGLKKAVDNELKSERLKTELITNVSHDIRTPLTSIITYVDLLKKEQDPAKVKEYIGVLEQKAQKLKLLTDDLFEAAKASTGNIPVHPEDLNIVSLIRQGLGEKDGEVEKSGLQFKLNVPDEKLMVRADGKLLWRAVENLLTNIFKYALPGSRVYIDMEELDREIAVTFKNISAQELNVPAEELLERFTRGDAARTSEGSGLGLNIAKSLVELMHGRLEIEVDGDLFKAKIRLPKVNAA